MYILIDIFVLGKQNLNFYCQFLVWSTVSVLHFIFLRALYAVGIFIKRKSTIAKLEDEKGGSFQVYWNLFNVDSDSKESIFSPMHETKTLYFIINKNEIEQKMWIIKKQITSIFCWKVTVINLLNANLLDSNLKCQISSSK